MKAWISQIIQCIQHNPELQTWSGHLQLRLHELIKIKSLALDTQKKQKLLEIGCGNGLGSVFFAKDFENIIASDLPELDHEKHSIGLVKAHKLITALKLQNIELLGCSGEKLPIAEKSIDTILALYSLEHIPNKLACLQECNRVLKKDGYLIFAVPGFFWSLGYPINFYHEFIIRLFNRFFKKNEKKFHSSEVANATVQQNDTAIVNDWASFHRVYPHFPIPKPHGEYQSYWEELFAFRSTSWEKLFLKANFNHIKIFPISIMPRALVQIFINEKYKKFWLIFNSLDDTLCKIPGAVFFAQFYLITAKK